MDLILKTRYLPEEQIGWGGFGKTFKAWDAHLQQYCVVKQLQPKNTSGNPFSPSELESIKRLFEREAQTLRDLSHSQIPRLYDYFELPAPSDSQQELFYLVQQYIQGETLDRELKTRGRFSEDEVVRDLRQILNILNYIHEPRRRVIHRDIKPSNIIRDENGKLYLIDFGAVKRKLEPGVPVEQSMAIRTPIFAPPEQLSGGEIFPCSDLYSLAVTCVCLLTGRSADKLWCQNRWIWKEYTNVSDHLANILDRMLLPNPSDRFQSAENVITALSGQISQNPNPQLLDNRETSESQNQYRQSDSNSDTIPEITTYSKLKIFPKKVFLLIGLFLLGSAIALFINWWIHRPICDFQNQYDFSFSCGEKILIPPNNIDEAIYNNKKTATEEFSKGHFNKAIKYFQKYLKDNKNDPEALIYLNNAKAALKNNPLKIVITLPIIQGDSIQEDSANKVFNDIAEQTLRGIAHIQQNTNKENGIKERLLFLEIVNYYSNQDKIRQIADAIVSKKDILGVIGFSSSDNTLKASESFGEPIVFISPTSTAVRGDDFPLFSKYVFRTSPNNSVQAEKIVKYMVRQKLKKTAIFYEDNNYTKSLIKEFEYASRNQTKPVMNNCQVSKIDEALNCLKQAKQNNAEVILLAFSNQLVANVAISIINDSEDISILGGDSLYIENVSKANILADKLRIAVPWHRSSGTNVTKCDDIKSKFEKESCNLWGTGDVSWRTAMSYDATAAMVEGLRRSNGNYTRQKLYEALKNPTFSAEGASANVEFKNGDRKPLPGIGVLVKVENNRFVIDDQSQQ